jgi:hypothetical protein
VDDLFAFARRFELEEGFVDWRFLQQLGRAS